MTHTAGPWKLDPCKYVGKDGGTHGYVEVSASGKAIWIAKVQTFSDDSGEMAANANLITAAPDLLEACKLLYDSTAVLNHLPLQSQNFLMDAIAKAEGKP